jgi:hypothetical protein
MHLWDNGVTMNPIIQALANVYNPSTSPAPFATLMDRGKAELISGHVIKAVYWIISYATGGGSFAWMRRRMTVTPIRVAG